MLQKKICMLGSYGVGKTSLISRFIHRIFSDKYQSTIGVKVNRKQMKLDGVDVNILLWDLHGDDEYQRVRSSYLRGTAGYILVVDSTRGSSLEVAIDLQQLASDIAGDVPFLTLINKCDLSDEWNLDINQLKRLEDLGWILHQTSAKTGKLVNESFELLTRKMIAADA